MHQKNNLLTSSWHSFRQTTKQTKSPTIPYPNTRKVAAEHRKHQPSAYDDLDQSLGQGNSASVHLVRRRADGQVFAAKRFSRALSSETNIIAEYYVANGLRHKNVVQTFELLEIGGSWNIVMEYVPGNLFDKVTLGSLDVDEVESCFSQLVAGVRYIHDTGFAHRDLKLENFLLHKDGQVKITDFGTAATSKIIPTSKWTWNVSFETELIFFSIDRHGTLHGTGALDRRQLQPTASGCLGFGHSICLHDTSEIPMEGGIAS